MHAVSHGNLLNCDCEQEDMIFFLPDLCGGAGQDCHVAQLQTAPFTL